MGYERAKSILTENRDALIRIAESLLVRESLDGTEIQLLISGRALKERQFPKTEAKPENMVPASAGSARPSPISPQEKPAPA